MLAQVNNREESGEEEKCYRIRTWSGRHLQVDAETMLSPAHMVNERRNRMVEECSHQSRTAKEVSPSRYKKRSTCALARACRLCVRMCSLLELKVGEAVKTVAVRIVLVSFELNTVRFLSQVSTCLSILRECRVWFTGSRLYSMPSGQSRSATWSLLRPMK